jgi:hypothetical protein
MAVTIIATELVTAIGAEHSPNPNPGKPDQHGANSALRRGQSTRVDYRQYRSLPNSALFQVTSHHPALSVRCYPLPIHFCTKWPGVASTGCLRTTCTIESRPGLFGWSPCSFPECLCAPRRPCLSRRDTPRRTLSCLRRCIRFF